MLKIILVPKDKRLLWTNKQGVTHQLQKNVCYRVDNLQCIKYTKKIYRILNDRQLILHNDTLRTISHIFDTYIEQ